MNARDTTKVYIWRLDTGCGSTLSLKVFSIYPYQNLICYYSFRLKEVYQQLIALHKLNKFVLVDSFYKYLKNFSLLNLLYLLFFRWNMWYLSRQQLLSRKHLSWICLVPGLLSSNNPRYFWFAGFLMWYFVLHLDYVESKYTSELPDLLYCFPLMSNSSVSGYGCENPCGVQISVQFDHCILSELS